MTIGQKRCGLGDRKDVEPMIIETARKRIAEIIDGLEQQRGEKTPLPQAEKSKGLFPLRRQN